MKQIYIFLVCLLASIGINAQDKVMTVDNQTPGWLSSKMTYAQQVAVEDLTVTGYINPADMQFLNTLIKARKLVVLNLNKANLVDNEGNDNILWGGFMNFGDKKVLRKLILPHNLIASEVGLNSKNIDSLIIDSNVGKAHCKFLVGHPNHLILTNNVTRVPTSTFYLGFNQTEKCIVTLPSSLQEIGPNAFAGCAFSGDFIMPKNIIRLGGPEENKRPSDSWWQETWNKEVIMPISKTRFDFPESLKAYYGGSKSESGRPDRIFAQHCYTSDTIVVGAKCDTLCVQLTAKIGYFKSITPPEQVVDYYYYKFDKVYVPKGCLDVYKKKFWQTDWYKGYIKDIEEIKEVEKIALRWTSPHQMLSNEHTNLLFEIQPSDAFDKRLKWSSDNEEVATVDENGEVYAHKSGTATITVTTYDGSVSNSCEIIVAKPVAGVSIEPAEVELTELGKTAQLTAKIQPEDATNKNVTWKSSNESVCSISADGSIIATGYGKTVVLATTEDGNFVGTCIVVVTEASAIKQTSLSESGFKVIDRTIVFDDSNDVESQITTLGGALVYKGNAKRICLRSGMYLVKAGSKVRKVCIP